MYYHWYMVAAEICIAAGILFLQWCYMERERKKLGEVYSGGG